VRVSRAASVSLATTWLALASLAIETRAAPAASLIDDFESSAKWKAVPAAGVTMKLSNDAGVHGRSLRVDFDFVHGGGYAVFHRDLDLDLPANYRFTFRLRGACRPNNLEFKLVDSSGANVWWCNRRDFAFPLHWEIETIQKRHISFAWGPAGGGEIRHVAAIELAVTAGQGGSGTVWLDDLELTALPLPTEHPPRPIASARSERAGRRASFAVDGDTTTWWASGVRDPRPILDLDLGIEREFGGLTIDWADGMHARDYVVETSLDHRSWIERRMVRNGNGGRDPLFLPESDARWIRIRVLCAATTFETGIREITIEPLEWGSSLERFYEAIAKRALRGSYPRAIGGEQVYWTIVGAGGFPQKCLLSEDGALEVGKRGWSIEPFLWERGREGRPSAPHRARAMHARGPARGGRLWTWADVRSEASLEDGSLPIPTVRWSAGDLDLTVTAIATGSPEGSEIRCRYRVANHGREAHRVSLILALRPFQVNPPAQFLNVPGGVTRIRALSLIGPTRFRVDRERVVIASEPPARFGAATFDEGDVVDDFLRLGRFPARTSLADSTGLASGALAFDLDLAPGAEREIALSLPSSGEAGEGAARFDADLERSTSAWRASLERVRVRLPDSAADVARTLEAQLGYILVNRDRAALQPGARAYARTWIRDGSLASAALLRLGHPEVVRDFIEWFAPYQYPDGKIPCCVDQRGADPVPEHDSHGEFIFLVAEYYRYTHDRDLVKRLWPRVRAAAAAIDTLRAQRRGREWLAPDRKQFFGLLPPSISHEGYSAKPMHSYWDDLFALRGLKDAAWLAGALGHDADRKTLARSRDEFARDLTASVRAAMAAHHIDYVPGCADLGDFDATSTTIALDPVQAESVIPRAALERTFERYWKFFIDRRDGKQDWDAYTPYEMRTIGAFVRLGWRERAGELLAFFMKGRRPSGWKQWPEVVWKDDRTPHFLGDLPHAWVAADYVRSICDMLAYVRESDGALVVGAGVQRSWIEGDGLEVRRLATPYGALSYAMKSRGDTVEVKIDGGIDVPLGGVLVFPPDGLQFFSVRIDGTMSGVAVRDGSLAVYRVPVTLQFVR
jgi:hypothetical protein